MGISIASSIALTRAPRTDEGTGGGGEKKKRERDKEKKKGQTRCSSCNVLSTGNKGNTTRSISQMMPRKRRMVGYERAFLSWIGTIVFCRCGGWCKWSRQAIELQREASICAVQRGCECVVEKSRRREEGERRGARPRRVLWSGPAPGSVEEDLCKQRGRPFSNVVEKQTQRR